MMIPWEKWYGTEVAIAELMKRSRHLLRETLKEGFEGLRILGHAPSRSSAYWKDFLVFEETIGRGVKSKPLLNFCGYSLMDCPAAAIPSIAENHTHCLIHHGDEWEWLLSETNQLHSHTVHYKHPR